MFYWDVITLLVSKFLQCYTGWVRKSRPQVEAYLERAGVVLRVVGGPFDTHPGQKAGDILF